jgi:hypothetical protein
MLRDSFRRSANRLNGGFYEVRNSVDLCFLNHLVVRYVAGSKDVVRVESSAVPDATNVIARKDLRKPACFYVANFNEPRVEKENIGCMEGSTIGTPLPFNGASITTWITLLIDIDAKF